MRCALLRPDPQILTLSEGKLWKVCWCSVYSMVYFFLYCSVCSRCQGTPRPISTNTASIPALFFGSMALAPGCRYTMWDCYSEKKKEIQELGRNRAVIQRKNMLLQDTIYTSHEVWIGINIFICENKNSYITYCWYVPSSLLLLDS